MRRGISGINARFRNSDKSTVSNDPMIRPTAGRELNPLEVENGPNIVLEVLERPLISPGIAGRLLEMFS